MVLRALRLSPPWPRPCRNPSPSRRASARRSASSRLSRMIGWLARVCRPLLLLDASLLLAGVLLTSFNLLLIGWTVYAVGHVLAILAFLSVAAFRRDRMDGWTWAGLLTLEAGVHLAPPPGPPLLSGLAHTPLGAP